MTFTDYRTAARMRDVIADVAADVVDRKRPGYRYATVDSIDEVKNRANVIFAGEVSAVPVRMGAIKPTDGSLVRIRGKHGDLHVEDVVNGTIGDFSMEHLTAEEMTLESTTPQIHFIDTNVTEQWWVHLADDIFYILLDRDGDGNWETPHPMRIRAATNQIEFWQDVFIIGADGRLELPNTQSVIIFGAADAGGPLGLEFVSGEGKFYYRTSPNQFSIEDGNNVNIMDWDVDDRRTQVHGDLIVHELSALTANEIVVRSSMYPVPNIGEGAESTRPDAYPRGITTSPTVASAQGWPLSTGARGITLTVHSGTGGFQLVCDSNTNQLHFRARDHGSNNWNAWRTLA